MHALTNLRDGLTLTLVEKLSKEALIEDELKSEEKKGRGSRRLPVTHDGSARGSPRQRTGVTRSTCTVTAVAWESTMVVVVKTRKN